MDGGRAVSKPILFYTVHTSWGIATVLAVTAIADDGRRLYYGLRGDHRHHCYHRECVGKFPTAEAAEAEIPAITAITRIFAQRRGAINDALAALNKEQTAALVDAY